MEVVSGLEGHHYMGAVVLMNLTLFHLAQHTALSLCLTTANDFKKRRLRQEALHSSKVMQQQWHMLFLVV